MDQGQSKFFQLSYPSNPQNPAIIDCLKLCEDEHYGRHVITTKRLNSGDIVAIEKPFYKSLDKTRSNPTRCASCLRSCSKQFISCSSCSSVKFCSGKCKILAWEEFHKYECNSIDELSQEDGFLMMVERTLFKVLSICDLENLEKLVNEHFEPMTIFNVNMKENQSDVKKKLILVCHSLESAPPTEDEIIFANKFVTQHEFLKSVWKTEEHCNFLINFVIKFIGILNRNSFTLHWPSSTENETGCGIFPFACLINHSCTPNLTRFFVDGCEVFIAKHPIEANQQLFISYR